MFCGGIFQKSSPWYTWTFCSTPLDDIQSAHHFVPCHSLPKVCDFKCFMESVMCGHQTSNTRIMIGPKKWRESPWSKAWGRSPNCAKSEHRHLQYVVVDELGLDSVHRLHKFEKDIETHHSVASPKEHCGMSEAQDEADIWHTSALNRASQLSCAAGTFWPTMLSTRDTMEQEYQFFRNSESSTITTI